MVQKKHCTQLCLLTTFVALPLLDLERQVKGADGEVDSLGVHSSHLADKRGSQITFQRLPLRTTKEREGEREEADRGGEGGDGESERDREIPLVSGRQREREREIILIQPETSAITEGVFEALSQGSYGS